MALTAVEEAQLRDLIAQQSALLSLAGVEPTILSKLGATKVTLSGLPTASVINDADLLLLRQGVTDKSVTGLTFKNLIPTIADATTTVKGIVELATDAETQAGTDTVRAITPSNLSSRTATELRTGLAKVATQEITNAGTNDSDFITALKLKNTKLLRASEDKSFGVNYTATSDGFFIANSTNGGSVNGGFTITVAGTIVVYSRSTSEGASGYQTGMFPVKAGETYIATLQGAGASSLGAFFVPFN